jgi:hypothetical protein
VRDVASAGLLAVGCAFVVIVLRPGALTGLGYVLLFMWALYVIWGTHRFGSALQIPADAAAATCASVHLKQLRRQRDLVLSWPLGMGLAMPAVVLVALGLPLGPKHMPWAAAVALISVCVFVYLAAVIYGKIVAGGWQAEIAELEALIDKGDSGERSGTR